MLFRSDVGIKSIEMISQFLFKTLELQSTLTEIDIDDTHFSHMAEKACGGSEIRGFTRLNQDDIETILKMCL